MSEPKPPRLHGFSSVADAAAWLTYWDDEVWTPEAVISRLYAEWIPVRHDVVGRPLPETVAVVLSKGTKLISLTDGTEQMLPQAQTLYIAGVEQFLRDLHECGEAMPLAVVTGEMDSPRWRPDTLLTLTNVRLSEQQIEVLQKPFSDLIRLIALGHIEPIGEVDPTSRESGAVKPLPAPVSRSTAQDAAILAALREAGHDPLDLPRNTPGKGGIPAKLRTSLVGKNALFPTAGTQFNHAWERLASLGKIAYRS